ncbi:MAG: permease [Peptococcaceae bacterium]|nr:permease [Peptococcaceae bacterium]
MSQTGLNSQVTGEKYQRNIWLALIFAIIAVAGVFYVKWNPYYHKVFIAAAKHSIGASIISGKTNVPPAPSWAAAWSFTVGYFKSVWEAVVLGILLGSLVQVLIPTDWVIRMFNRTSFGSAAAASALAVPSMMCTCCAAPVTVGLRKQQASVGSSLAFWLANPVLNPATIIFMGFVLSWKYAILRIVVGVILIFAIAPLGDKWADATQLSDNVIAEAQPASSSDEGNLVVRWLRALGVLIIDTIPAYLIVVFVLGAARAWLFPVLTPAWDNSIIVLITLAIAGALFVIPTAGEVPIIQTLLSFGLGVGPAAALLITLPAISLPSIMIVKRVFTWRILAFTTATVVVAGILAGFAANLLF